VEKTRVKVTIFGREYTIMSEVDPDYINKAAAFLDGKMREVAENFPNVSENRVAVLAALNITDELFKSGNGADSGKNTDDDVEERIIRLTRELSQVL